MYIYLLTLTNIDIIIMLEDSSYIHGWWYFFEERYGLGFTSVRPLFSKQLQIPDVVDAVMLDCGMSLITMIQNHAKKKKI